ncbi:MAG: 2Fe-2S iron-sulfur cluster-binding protein [Candidatus Kryptoniota bacterium]
MPRIKFVPLGKEVELEEGQTILNVARANGIPLGSSCSGDCICGWCRVEVIEGIENLSKPGDCEREISSKIEIKENERLACAAVVFGDIVVTTGYW